MLRGPISVLVVMEALDVDKFEFDWFDVTVSAHPKSSNRLVLKFGRPQVQQYQLTSGLAMAS